MARQIQKETHPGVEPTHIPVGDAPAVDDVVRHHLVAARLRLVLVDPIGLVPVVMRDLAEGHLAIDDVADASKGEVWSDVSEHIGARQKSGSRASGHIPLCALLLTARNAMIRARAAV